MTILDSLFDEAARIEVERESDPPVDTRFGLETATGGAQHRNVALLGGVSQAWMISNAGAPARSPAALKRAVFYTRYSTVNQNESSTERQIEQASRYMHAHHCELIEGGIFSDEERSGGSMSGRERLKAMLAVCKTGAADVCIIENPDRLARDMVDLGWLWRQLARYGVELHAANTGRMTKKDVAIYALLSDEQRATMSERSQWGREKMVEEGRSPNGCCFGYRPVPGSPGRMVVDEGGQAETVRLMFALRVEGMPKIGIARTLNERRILSPTGIAWSASAVSVMLANARYRGLLIYNKGRHSKCPDTGKDLRTKRPVSDWKVTQVPELVIVDPVTWDAAQNVDTRSFSPTKAKGSTRAGKYLLSGKLHCPACGSIFKISLVRRDAVTRMICSKAVNGQGCRSRSTFDLGWVHKVVVGALRQELADPSWYREYMRALDEELAALVRDACAKRVALEREIAGYQRELNATFVTALTEGLSARSVVALRMKIEERLTAAETDLATLPVARPPFDLDLRRFGDLGHALSVLEDQPLLRDTDEASRRLVATGRHLIDHVVLRRPPGMKGFEAEIHVRLGAMIELGENSAAADCRILNVKFDRPCQSERARVRLSSESAAAFEAGLYSVDDATWAKLELLIPDPIAGDIEGPCRDPRRMLEAMLFALRASQPFLQVPSAFGDPGAFRRALTRFLCSGAWDRVSSVLQAEMPDLVEGLDLRRFAYLDRRQPGAKPSGSMLDAHREFILATVTAEPKITVKSLRELLSRRGVDCSSSIIDRLLLKAGMNYRQRIARGERVED